MKISNRIKFSLFILLIILNVVLRLQVVPHEMGYDSLEMHVMTNSLSEYGRAMWFLDPLSIIGLYPASYSSTMQFLLSGIHQTTNMEMNTVIFIYCIFLGVLSIFVAYLMAGFFIKDDVYKFIAAFCFSTIPSVLNYTTWTIPTRGLFIIIAPLVIYLLFKSIDKITLRNLLLIIILSAFLFATHHLFYLLLPIYVSFFIVICIFKTKLINIISYKEKIFSRFDNQNLSNYFTAFAIFMGFALMYLIPFVTNRFILGSRYDPIYIEYIRYISLLSIFAIGGLFYLIFKNNKNSKEWFLLLYSMFLMVFIYQINYMKWFIPIIAVIYSSIGLFNLIKRYPEKRYTLYVFIVFLFIFISISGYYQHLHEYQIQQRALRDSTVFTGNWMSDHIDGNCISNHLMLGRRICAVSETVHFLDSSDRIDLIYGFIDINISNYERYPPTSDDFWLSGYKGIDYGSKTWTQFHMLYKSPFDYNITHVVENHGSGGKIIWRHQNDKSELLQLAYENGFCVYDDGKEKIWELKEKE